MSDHFWLSEKQLARIKPYFSLSHGVPRVDDHKGGGNITAEFARRQRDARR